MKRNLNGFVDYTWKGTDRGIGNIRDFYFDDENWDIRSSIDFKTK